MPRTLLVYHPEEAEDYARLVRVPRGWLAVRAARTAEAAGPWLESTEVLLGWQVPPALLARMPRLAWVQSMGAGVEGFLRPELPARARLTRAAGIFGPWMAEYTLGWLLWVTQRMERFRDQQRRRQWRPANPARLHGATLVVVGLGDIGRTIARAAAAFGMTVLGVSRTGRPAPGVRRVYRTAALRRALAAADFAVLTLPLTRETRGLVDATALAALPRHAWLVNVGRGAVVDEDALVDALQAGRLAGAILDVFATEPLPPEHPLWGFEQVVVTPHISGPSTPEEVVAIFNDNLRRYLARRPLRHEVRRARGY